MKVKTGLKVLLGVLILIGMCACGPSEVYKIGQDMMAQNRPDEAIGYFEQALKEDPDNQEVKTALSKAREAAAKQHYTKAKKSLESSPELTLVTMEQVVKGADLALKMDPKNAEIIAFHKTARDKMKELQDQIKSLYAQAEQDMAKDDWVGAAAKLRQINRIAPNYEETGIRLAKVEQEGARYFYQQGIQLAAQDDWNMAAKAFKAVLDINPQFMDAAKLYEEAKNKDNPKYYEEEANKAAAAQNWPRAITLMEKALDYQPNNA
ncbi:MAG: tetratricopeptide repeat protein, partial [Syntrophales bacterium]|nr:tetratricopeptide repeat protein [Syntrophales bacterium]